MTPRRRASNTTRWPSRSSGSCSPRSIPDHQAALAHLLHLTHPLHLAEPLREQPDLGLQPDERALPLEDLERGDRGGAGQRVARVGVPVEEGLVFGVGTQEGLVDPLGGERRGQRHVPAGEPLGHAEQIGRDAFLLAGEHRPGPPEAGRDLVADQQRAVAVAEPPDGAQVPRWMSEHSRRPLDERLEDHRRDLLLVHGEQAGDVVDVTRLRPMGIEEQRPEGGVEERHPTDRDRADRVSVVGLLEADERGLPDVLAAAMLPVLERHLERDLNRRRPGVRVEDPAQPRRGDLHEARRQLGGARV